MYYLVLPYVQTEFHTMKQRVEKISAKLTKDKPKQSPSIPPTFAIRVVKVIT